MDSLQIMLTNSRPYYIYPLVLCFNCIFEEYIFTKHLVGNLAIIKQGEFESGVNIGIYKFWINDFMTCYDMSD